MRSICIAGAAGVPSLATVLGDRPAQFRPCYPDVGDIPVAAVVTWLTPPRIFCTCYICRDAVAAWAVGLATFEGGRVGKSARCMKQGPGS